jgi:integrase
VQKPIIERKGPSWIVRYGVKVYRGDRIVWVRRSKKLAPVCDEFRTAASVAHLAQEIVAPLNSKLARPESTNTVLHFLENVYLPYCEANVKPSTYAGYKFILKTLKPHLGNYLLRNFGTVEGEQLLNSFARQQPRAQTVLKNTKGFLSGGFRYAVRTGVLSTNPMRETLLPRGGKRMVSGHAHSLEELGTMLEVLPEPARTVILTAALTGMRGSEIRGLKWQDFTGDSIYVRRSVWRTHVGATKTQGSEAPIPVIPFLADALNRHKKSNPGPYVFSGGTGQPLVLANLIRRVIKPRLQEAGIKFNGLHGFRRGLATTLSGLGVSDVVTQQILRHASVEVTRKHYIKVSTPQANEAMKKLAKALSRGTNRGTKRAQTSPK